MANADLPAWLETLALLQSKPYHDYTVISGRGGVVSAALIKNQVDFIKDAHKKLEKFSQKKQKVDLDGNLIQQLLSNFKVPSARQKQYAQRLRYGLKHYYARHYQSDNSNHE